MRITISSYLQAENNIAPKKKKMNAIKTINYICKLYYSIIWNDIN